MKKNILIAGGAGFLGSHLCDFFVKKGCNVICVDNLITGVRSNISGLLKNKNFKFIEHDITESLNIRDELHYVLNFASPASPKDYLKYPFETLKSGSLGTENLLELARKKKAVFLLASTSEIYGDPLVHPQKESYWGNVNPIGPRAVYDEAKRYAEAVTSAYHRYYKLDIRIVRIFNAFGPRMRFNDGRAIPSFIGSALKNRPIEIQGNGSQVRCFCYVSDLVEGIYRLMKSGETGPVNIGNTREITMTELAVMIKDLTGSRNKISYRALPQDDPKIRCPDISRARKILKWEPEVTLEKGLAETIEWIKENNVRNRKAENRYL